MFITFEGGEGTGKSTQVKLLAAELQTHGREVFTTREPGGTPEAEQLRALLVSGGASRWTPGEEALLIYAARSTHLREVIRPAIGQGKIVICDRFIDSTRAYQQYAATCTPLLLDALEEGFVAPTWPDLTLVFDLDPVIGLQRAKQRGEAIEDRFERKELTFHRNVREGFLTIARDNPKRCRIVDASQPIQMVADQVWKSVNG